MIHALRTLLAFLVLVFFTVPLAAQDASPAGRWALRAGGRTLMILSLTPAHDQGGLWTGSLSEPRRLRWNESSFSDVEGPIVERPMRPARASPTGIAVALRDGVPGQPDDFQFRVAADGMGELSVTGFTAFAYQLVRANEGDAVVTDWDQGRSYAADHIWPTNVEMTAIFDADRADRPGVGAAIDWSVVGPRDEARRMRTLALLNAGTLRSGDDFYHAAFVFQHGSAPNDYLLAHTLAVIAAARGKPEATWIAAATLDRYLQHIGRPQIFGTQFQSRSNQPTTQEPYDRALVSDALRQALGVPPQAEQESQRAQFEAQARAAEAQRAPRP